MSCSQPCTFDTYCDDSSGFHDGFAMPGNFSAHEILKSDRAPCGAMSRSASTCSLASSNAGSGASSSISTGVEESSATSSEGSSYIDSCGSVRDEVQSCGMHPSVGSAQHEDGLCKPCHYLSSKKGCPHGRHCRFCHYRHCRRPIGDISKAQRQMCQYLVSLIHQAHAGADEKAAAEAQLLSYLCQGSRLSGYTDKVLRCFQGSAPRKSDVANRVLDEAAQCRKRIALMECVSSEVKELPAAVRAREFGECRLQSPETCVWIFFPCEYR